MNIRKELNDRRIAERRAMLSEFYADIPRCIAERRQSDVALVNAWMEKFDKARLA